MKKILLLSDTHSYIDDKILVHAASADEVWHAGDIGTLSVTDKLEEKTKLRGVYGNIDDTKIRQTFPLHQRFNCEGVDVWMTHIGGSPGNYRPEIREELQKNPPKLFICGHSHILKVMYDKRFDMLHMNPGAIGKHGFHQVRTMLRFTLAGGQIKNLEVIEFAR